MSRRFNVFIRFACFGLVAGLLIWLGTSRPRVAASGPGVVLVRQGSNTTFLPQNPHVSFLVIGSTNTVTNLPAGLTNEAGK